MPLEIIVNGVERVLAALERPATLDRVIAELGLAPGRVAVERNGEIAPRASWSGVEVQQGDRLEVVHFVGGGSSRADYEVPSV